MLSDHLAPRTDFGEAPPGYVPGLGRGAVGFTTRSDIGPARAPTNTTSSTSSSAPPGAPTPPGAPPPGFPGNSPAPPKEGDYSESQFDQFAGFSENLFASDTYNADDKAADEVYKMIDARMEERHRAYREAREAKESEDKHKQRPKLAQQFRDVKRGLAAMSESDWASLPEAMDMTRRAKIAKKQAQTLYYSRVPDSVVDLKKAGVGATVSSVDVSANGLQTPASSDLTQLGKARDKVLSLKLDRISDRVDGQTVVDPKGYLTDLNALRVNSDTEVSDIKKARLLLRSVVSTNPKHAPGWIATARLEAETGRMLKARQLIMKGCKTCPSNEDVWLEAIRLHPPASAKGIAAQAVRHIPTSTTLWLAARDLEDDPEARKAVLRKALDMIPMSVKLWKSAVEQETPEDARILLSRAVECVPQSVELWLALVRLETYENAKKLLNRARSLIPTDASIWITAAKLEEANGNLKNVDAVIRSALRSLAHHKVVFDRDSWLAEAENAEKAGSICVCQAIVNNTIGVGVDEADKRNTWIHDCEVFLKRGSVETARAAYAHMLSQYRSKEAIWKLAAMLEKEHGSHESVEKLLKEAVNYIPKSNDLWLMWAKDKWIQGDFDGAREVLGAAFTTNPESEEICLTAVSLEIELSEYDRASLLLQKARKQSDTAHVWMKSALLERQLGKTQEEHSMITKALDRFPKYPKLWMMLGQWHIRQCPPQYELAEHAYRQGVTQCPLSVALWLCYSRLFIINVGNLSRARSILEIARLKIPKASQLWLESVRIEERDKQHSKSQQMLAKALQQCPNSGELWAYSIGAAPRADKKRKCVDALNRCPADARVLLAVARLLWLDRKIRKARDWFNRAVQVDADLGDAWVYLYKFELQHGSSARQENVMQKCELAAPAHGEVWTVVSKGDVRRAVLGTRDVLLKASYLVTNDFSVKFHDLLMSRQSAATQ